jgi:hypothetical protein
VLFLVQTVTFVYLIMPYSIIYKVSKYENKN